MCIQKRTEKQYTGFNIHRKKNVLSEFFNQYIRRKRNKHDRIKYKYLNTTLNFKEYYRMKLLILNCRLEKRNCLSLTSSGHVTVNRCTEFLVVEWDPEQLEGKGAVPAMSLVLGVRSSLWWNGIRNNWKVREQFRPRHCY